jgi:hypothetical protein
MARAATVNEYIEALPPNLRELAFTARTVIDQRLEDGTSAIRWAHPTWSIGRTPVCYLKAASRHITLGFWQGASLDDPSGRLESSGTVMAHVKLRAVEDIDEDVFASWLRQAGALARRAPGRGGTGA